MRERTQFQTLVIARTLIAQRAGRGCHHSAMQAHDQHHGAKAQHDLLQRKVAQASPE